jgi:tripartite-type tricarboxylate transporter receptor subunit TctC
MRSVFRIGLWVAAIGIALISAGTSYAQSNWPQRSVRLIAPLPPGTAVDISARLFAERLAQRWGKGVVVENRQGADGIVAVTAFLGSGDGHTLLISFGGVTTLNPLVHKNLQYDPAELVPITLVVDNYLGVAVSSELKVNSIAELVKLAKQAPGKYTWAATPGQTSVLVPAFLKTAGIDMLRLSYNNFTMALQDLAQGRLSLAATSLSALLPIAQSGKAKVLMVTNQQRSPQAPEAETSREAGFPNLTLPGFVVLFGPKNMPAELRERIAADFREVAKDPALRARLDGLGLTLRVGTPAEAVAELNEQRAKMEAALKLTQ